MESIFDFNITQKELDYLFIKKDREEYERSTKSYSKYSDLYLLFKLRGDSIKAKHYLEKAVKVE